MFFLQSRSVCVPSPAGQISISTFYHQSYCKCLLDPLAPGDRSNIKMSSYQHRDSHYKDTTVSRPSYLYNRNPPRPVKTVVILRRASESTILSFFVYSHCQLVVTCTCKCNYLQLIKTTCVLSTCLFVDYDEVGDYGHIRYVHPEYVKQYQHHVTGYEWLRNESTRRLTVRRHHVITSSWCHRWSMSQAGPVLRLGTRLQ